MGTATWYSLLGVVSLATVHLFAGKLRFLDIIPRSRWLSFGSGISVAYVFLHLLPEIGEAEVPVSRAMRDPLPMVDHHVYLLTTLGVATFYGLERLAERTRASHRRRHGHDRTPEGVFWLHVGSFGVYNVLIGYVLAGRGERPLAFFLFSFAMALHFLVNDYGLRFHHKELYGRWGRWVLALGVGTGWVLGLLYTLPEVWRLVPLAFIAGGMILNVLKEELPRERESRFWAFALGLAGYGAVLLAAV